MGQRVGLKVDQRVGQVGMWRFCENLPTGMPLALMGYEARCHLCCFRPRGQAHSFFLIGFVEERGLVRIGSRGSIVTIEVRPPRIGAIVRIAQQHSAAETACRSSTYFCAQKRKQSYAFSVIPASQRTILFVFSQRITQIELADIGRPLGGGASRRCSLYSTPPMPSRHSLFTQPTLEAS